MYASEPTSETDGNKTDRDWSHLVSIACRAFGCGENDIVERGSIHHEMEVCRECLSRPDHAGVEDRNEARAEAAAEAALSEDSLGAD